MSRPRLAAALVSLVVGCNSILGVHDFQGDATRDADPCTGVCECRVDTDCADPHAVCIDAITTRTCECAAGYLGSACAWSGVVGDPGFDHGAPWIATGGATVLTTATGSIDPGYAELDAGKDCTMMPAVSQTIVMPRRSRAQAFVLQINRRAAEIFGETEPLVTNIGIPWTTGYASASNQFSSVRSCLGGGQYAPEASVGSGAPLPLTAAVVPTIGLCLEQSEVDLDHLDIVPADPGECPDPGEALNGSAEASAGGWVFTHLFGSDASTAGEAGTIAGFGSDVGVGSSSAVFLQDTQNCNQPTASVLVSVPTLDATGGPVFRLYHRTTSTALHLRLDDRVLPPSPDVEGTYDSYCAPTYLAGSVVTFSAWLGDDTKACANDTFSGVVDDLTFTHDPQCGGDPGIADPGFEATAETALGFATTNATAAVLADVSAHGGAHDAQLAITETCGVAKFTATVIPPVATAGGGPALTFFYELPGTGTATATRAQNSTGSTALVDRTTAWAQALVCLDPSTSTLVQQVTIELADAVAMGTGSACGKALPQGTSETLLLDDLATTVSPACPAN